MVDNNYVFTLWQFDVIKNLNNRTQLVQNRITHQYMIKKIMPLSEYDLHKQLCSIRCNNIVQVYDVVKDNNVCIALEEYIQGYTIEQLCQNSHQNEKTAKKIILQLCDGLEVLHSNKIVHRDITPSNIIVRTDGVVKIIDFDISRFQNQYANKDTNILGTEGYAAPEQFGFSQSDNKTDIYALGVLLNFMLTGELPVDRPYIEGQLGNIIKKCTQIDPQKRYKSVYELKCALTGGLEKGLYVAENIFRNIPGYRTKTKSKEVIATIGYFLKFLCIFLQFCTFGGSFKNNVIIAIGSIGGFIIPTLLFWDFLGFQESIPIIRSLPKPLRRTLFGILAVVIMYHGLDLFFSV